MKITAVLKGYLFFAGIYLILDGLIHILGIRLIDITRWSKEPLVYSDFINRLYGSFVIFVGLLGIEVQTDLMKYKKFLYIAAIWSFFHAGYLVYTAVTVDFIQTFAREPSVYIWMPFYNYYLIFEAALLLCLSLLVYLLRRSAK